MGPLPLRLAPWLKPVVTPLVYNPILLNNFLLLTRLYKKRLQSTWIQQRSLHRCQLTKANADNEAIHIAFRNGRLR